MIPYPSNYKTKKEDLSIGPLKNQVRSSSPGTHNLIAGMLDASVSKGRGLLLTSFLVFGVVFNTTVGDLHCFTPKVVGF